MLGTSKIPPLPHFDNNYRYHLPHLGPCPPSPQHHIVSRSLTHAKEDIGGATILTTDTKFFVQLDTRGYFQDELEVRTDNGFLIISGESGERGPVEFKTKRSFCRRFLLPDNCKDDELECELGGVREDDTILKVTVPREIPDDMGKVYCISVSRPDHVSSSKSPSFAKLHGLIYAEMYDHHQLGDNGYDIPGVEWNKDNFVLRLDLPRFSLDQIMVKTTDDYLVVEGKQEEKEDRDEGTITSCWFQRKYLLPVNADKDAVTCVLNEDGRLKVIIPRM